MGATFIGEDGQVYVRTSGSAQPPEPGSITTEMFAPDAKSPSAATADAVMWAGVTGKPAVIAAGASAADARTSIGAIDDSGAITAISSKTTIVALTKIDNPAEATAEEVAALINQVIDALQS